MWTSKQIVKERIVYDRYYEYTCNYCGKVINLYGMGGHSKLSKHKDECIELKKK